ncbi:MAG: phosphoribosylformylglycinamidine cyclo-ligase [Pseudomonadota bacterium]
MTDAYKQAGVDIEAGNRLIKKIAPFAAATARAGADAALGGFGGLFDLKAAGYEDPLLVSGTDGVGTKLMLAFATGRHDTIGIDLVAMCVNDVLAQGAEPLFFLDYLACGKLDEGVAADIVAGVAEGCRRAGAALIGGETAEMPGMYAAGHYDLGGFCVGAVNRDAVLPKTDQMAAGDLLIGLPSSGAHSNGYSLIRKIVADAGLDWEDASPFGEGSLSDAFLTPTEIYVKPLLPLCQQGRVKGLAHITGGGLSENIPRALPDALTPRLDEAALTLPPLFAWLKEAGQLSDQEVQRTFNAGIGMVLIVSPNQAGDVLGALPNARAIGELAPA